jgi:hypothetical protein
MMRCLLGPVNTIKKWNIKKDGSKSRIYKKDKIIEGVMYFRWPRPTENCDPNV